MNVLDFCGVGDIRYYLNSPFYVDGNVCCSNGHVLAWKHENEIRTDNAPDDLKNRVRGMMDIDHSRFKPCSFEMPEIEMRNCAQCEGTGKCTRTECEECDGEGEVELTNDYSDYEVECKTCDGDGFHRSIGGEICMGCEGSGEVTKEDFIRFHVCGVSIQYKYAKMIHGEGLECFKDGDMLYFKKDGLTGIVMGCRHE